MRLHAKFNFEIASAVSRLDLVTSEWLMSENGYNDCVEPDVRLDSKTYDPGEI